ncbi:hypothetical protein [Stieleria mannarensis]|uniref:hypothetical protein n=1 Tax=Stieleria mannarensis TaxID=2755585 RepID=UPI0016047ECE|nr:hypothetical protein [Rhodopirellula sp. JC639]
MDAAFLDVIELNPVRSQTAFEKGLQKSLESEEEANQSTGRFARMRSRIAKLVRSLTASSVPLALIDSEPAWIAGTKNQENALRPVYRSYPRQSAWIDAATLDLLAVSAAKFSLFYTPVLLLRWLQCNQRIKRTFKKSFRIYLRTYGIYIAGRYWLKKSRPGCVILSNDHVGTYCALNQAAQDEGIPTVYIQHACVAAHFPTLKFDYALLDGRDAFDKYGTSTRTKVFLTGIAKYDHTQRVETCLSLSGDGQGSAIGVCFNLLDDFQYTTRMLEQLRSDFAGRKILARLHPATPPSHREAVGQLCADLDICISDSRAEDSFGFLARVGVLVCGASSIVLEAALMGVPSVLHYSSEIGDVYGFVKQGLSRHAKSLDAIAREIDDLDHQPRRVLAEKAEYFCAGCGQADRPAAATLAADLIAHLCQATEPSGWRKTDDSYYEWKAEGEEG